MPRVTVPAGCVLLVLDSETSLEIPPGATLRFIVPNESAADEPPPVPTPDPADNDDGPIPARPVHYVKGYKRVTSL